MFSFNPVVELSKPTVLQLALKGILSHSKPDFVVAEGLLNDGDVNVKKYSKPEIIIPVIPFFKTRQRKL